LNAAAKSPAVHHLHLLRDNFLCQSIHAPSQFCFIQFLVTISIELLHHLLSPSFRVEARQATTSEASSSDTGSGQAGCTRRASLIATRIATSSLSSLLRLNILRCALGVPLGVVILSVHFGGKPTADQEYEQDC
jgi:hypothetical protein